MYALFFEYAVLFITYQTVKVCYGSCVKQVEYEEFTSSHRSTNTPFTFLYNLSFLHCMKSCSICPQCNSISYNIVSKDCHLLSQRTTLAALAISGVGWMYTNKKTTGVSSCQLQDTCRRLTSCHLSCDLPPTYCNDIESMMPCDVSTTEGRCLLACSCVPPFHGKYCASLTPMRQISLNFVEDTENVRSLEKRMSGTYELTICFWIKIKRPANLDRPAIITVIDYDQNCQAILIMYHENERKIRVKFGSRPTVFYYLEMNQNKWYHMCVTVELHTTKDVILYVNGKYYGKQTAPESYKMKSQSILIGQDSDHVDGGCFISQSKNTWKGEITSLNVWRSVLKEADIWNVFTSMVYPTPDVISWNEILEKTVEEPGIIEKISTS